MRGMLPQCWQQHWPLDRVVRYRPVTDTGRSVFLRLVRTPWNILVRVSADRRITVVVEGQCETSWRCHALRLCELRDHGLHGFVVLPLPYQLTLRRIDGKQGQERLAANTP